MNFQFIKQWATIGCFSLAVISGLTQDSQAEQSRGKASFFCGTHEGKPATIMRLPQKDGKTTLRTLIVWEIDAFEDYPAEERCPLVSQKFQDNQNTGDLVYIVSGKANTWPVLCASKESHDYIVDCPDSPNHSNVLMTLLPGDDSQGMIEKLDAVNRNRSTKPLRHSSDEVLVRNGNLRALHVKKWMENSPETNNNISEYTSTSSTPIVDSPETNIEEYNQCGWGPCE
ncbi:COP23 domain-containing protein [Crocosphaera sp.]|uniref:COP23 domain-containing protein n=1 Tax=Crocosphaera sp. TaxID=2729996 RepID=UPI003F2595A5